MYLISLIMRLEKNGVKNRSPLPNVGWKMQRMTEWSKPFEKRSVQKNDKE